MAEILFPISLGKEVESMNKKIEDIWRRAIKKLDLGPVIAEEPPSDFWESKVSEEYLKERENKALNSESWPEWMGPALEIFEGDADYRLYQVVFFLYFAPDGGRCIPLEVIADYLQEYGVTEEEIVEIEDKVIERLRLPPVKRRMKRVIPDFESENERLLFKWIFREELEEIFQEEALVQEE